MSKCPHCHQAVDCTGLRGVVECPYCRKQFTCTPTQPTPTVAKQLPNATAAPSDPFDFTSDSPVSSTRRFMHKKKKPKGLWDFIDLGFHHYLTPIIVKIIWGLCLALAALGLAVAALFLIHSMLPEEASHASSYENSGPTTNSRPSRRTSSQPSVVEEKTMELVYKILSWIGLAVITVIILLVVRVICESIIVLFNIAESLVSIDKKTAVQTVIA